MNAKHLVHARHRLENVAPEVRPLFEELVRQVELAAAALAPLQALYDDCPQGYDRRNAYGRLLNFIDGDISDVIRGIMSDLPVMIPAGPGWAEEADPSEMHADAELLVRYLAVGGMAAEHPAIPDSARRLFADVEDALRDWETNVTEALRRIDDLVLRPALENAA